jgi:pyruvate kinase
MNRHIKIVATLGPATDAPGVVDHPARGTSNAVGCPTSDAA